MNARLGQLLERIDNLEYKERMLVLIATVFVLVALWHHFALQPLERSRDLLQNQLAQQQATQVELDAEAVRIVEVSQRDPNVPLRQQIAAAERQTQEFEREIRERAGQLIAPEEMAQILQSVLQKTRGLEFVSLEGLGAEPLLAPAPATAGAAPRTAAAASGEPTGYRHGFRIRFNGSYLDTLAYLHALEALPWRFFWDTVDIDVMQHPQALATIVVYTLSLDRRWIGV